MNINALRRRNDVIRGHPLIDQDLADQLPPLYAQDGKGPGAIVYAKWFTPDSSWTWYATEYDPETGLFFGLAVDANYRIGAELGYGSLDELEQIRGGLGLPVERELWFRPCTPGKIARQERVYSFIWWDLDAIEDAIRLQSSCR